MSINQAGPAALVSAHKWALLTYSDLHEATPIGRSTNPLIKFTNPPKLWIIKACTEKILSLQILHWNASHQPKSWPLTTPPAIKCAKVLRRIPGVHASQIPPMMSHVSLVNYFCRITPAILAQIVEETALDFFKVHHNLQFLPEIWIPFLQIRQIRLET